MTLGTFGSTLSDELNRLANGGTYRTMATMVDEALAAKQWANRENINPYSTDTVGILNEIAGLGTDKRNWLDFNGVCNYIAGTTGLPAAAALRQVYNTTDLLTSQSAYYVDATAPTNWGSLGYIYLNGVAGNYLTVPDSNALDITGDLDIRAYIAMDDWTPAAAQHIVSKWSGSTQLSYVMLVGTDGKINLWWSPDGTSGNAKFTTSSVAPTIADGSPLWIRATLDVDNGASGNDVKFFTSTDGSSWTQLGTTQTTAGVTSVFAGNLNLGLGANSTGGSIFTGRFYRSQVFAGLTGTDKRLDVNIATDYLSSNQSFFTATTGQTVTVNGVDTIANLGSAGSLLPTTLGSSTAADSNDPKFLDFTGTNYVYLPGVNGNYLSVPDANALDITGDIDIRWYGAADAYVLAGRYQRMLAKRTLGQWSWDFYFDADGRLTFAWTANGSTSITKNSTVAPTVANGTPIWLRVTLDVDNGASGNDVTFYTSNNGTTWTQLGSVVTTAGTTSIHSGTAPIEIGSTLTGQEVLVGKTFRAQVLNGINGTTVLDVDTSVITAGSQTSFTAVTGQTVTINRSTSGRKTVAVTQPTWLFGTDDYMEVNNRYMSSGTYLYLPGVASNYTSAPDSAALDITGDLDLRVKVALDDWTPSAENAFIGKWTSGQKAYLFNITAGGLLSFIYTTDGNTNISRNSSVATGIADGSTKWIRVTVDVDNGSTQNETKFFTSDDGTTWTQLGTTQTSAGVISFLNTTAPLEIGSVFAGSTFAARGKFFRAQIRNGIDGTVAFDANFESSITSLDQASFTESSSNAATVTINRSGSAYRSAGITTAGYLYPGATNTFSASATDYLNFGASDSFTVMWIGRMFATPASFGRLVSHRFGSGITTGYDLNTSVTTFAPYFEINDGIAVYNNSLAAQTAGSLLTWFGRRNINTRKVETINSVATGQSNDTSTGSISTPATLRIGTSSSGTSYQDMELYGVAIFRSALTASQVRQISNYFANREVYL